MYRGSFRVGRVHGRDGFENAAICHGRHWCTAETCLHSRQRGTAEHYIIPMHHATVSFPPRSSRHEKTRLTNDHERKVRAALGDNLVPLQQQNTPFSTSPTRARWRPATRETPTWLGRLAMPMPSENGAAAMADEGGRARRQEQRVCGLGSAGGGERGREG